MHWIEYVVIKVFYGLFSKISFRTAQFFADLLSLVLQHIVQYRRKVILENLKRVYGDNLPADQKILLRNIYRNFTYLWFEVLQAGKLNDKNFNNHFEIHNLDILEKAINEKKGVVLVSGHFGNFEWIACLFGINNWPFAGIAKKQKNKRVDDFIRKTREKNGADVIYTKSAIKDGLKFIKNGGVLGIVGDQDARHKGIFVNFLGIPSSTAVGTAIFHLRSGAPLIFIIAIRTRYAHFKIYIEEVPVSEVEGISDEAIQKVTQTYSDILSKWVLEYPEQWFWMHKRWKTSPPAAVKP
ncbi:MAG: lysophospholipid acyltransferase family protein [Calditrichae bacterium]|nr:lysophospholipid acyltransferase family protein [Calditrichota bacterium]MCB9059139.1 lysophospholipid acyltransferase family protein [Calditrichia bacterium]